MRVGGKSVVPRCMEGSSKGGGALDESWREAISSGF